MQQLQQKVTTTTKQPHEQKQQQVSLQLTDWISHHTSTGWRKDKGWNVHSLAINGSRKTWVTTTALYVRSVSSHGITSTNPRQAWQHSGITKRTQSPHRKHQLRTSQNPLWTSLSNNNNKSTVIKRVPPALVATATSDSSTSMDLHQPLSDSRLTPQRLNSWRKNTGKIRILFTRREKSRNSQTKKNKRENAQSWKNNKKEKLLSLRRLQDLHPLLPLLLKANEHKSNCEKLRQ